MSFEEFQESEVMFSDDSSDQSNDNQSKCSNALRIAKRRKNVGGNERKQQRVCSSAPVNIPGNCSFHVARSEPFDGDFHDDDHNDDDDVMVMRLPPHVILERRANGEMARSFSPLKGKHLCEVRNSILRMTGFLET